MNQRFTQRIIGANWYVLTILLLLVSQIATAQSSATISANVAWSSITWTGGTPTTGTNITLTVSGSATISGVPGTAFGSLQLTQNGGSRTLTMQLASSTSFTSVTMGAAAANAMNLTISGAPLDCPTVTIQATTASTLDLGGLGYDQAMTIVYTGNTHILTNVGSGSWPALTLSNTSGAARSFTFNNAPSSASFASVTVSSTSAANNVTIGTAALNTTILNLNVAATSTFNFNSLGYAGDLEIRVNSSASPTINGLPNSNMGKLTVDNRSATARTVNWTNSNASTAPSSLEMKSTGGGTLTIAMSSNVLRTSANANTVNVAGTGVLNLGGSGTNYASGTTFSAQAVGGDLSVQGWISSQTGVLLNLTADGSARNITVNYPSGGSFSEANLGSNVTLISGSNTATFTGSNGVYGSGSFTHNANTTLTTTRINISGTLTLNASNPLTINVNGSISCGTLVKSTSTATLNLGGDLTVSNTVTTTSSNTFTLVLNGSGSQTLTLPTSNTIYLNTVTINNTVTSTNWSGDFFCTGNLTNNGGTFTATAGTITFGGTQTISSSTTLILNNLTFSSQALTLSTSITVNGNFTGTSTGNPTCTLPKSSQRVLTFNGNFSNNIQRWATESAFIVSGDLYHEFNFKGSTVDFGTTSTLITWGTAQAPATGTHGVNFFFNPGLGGQTVSGSSGIEANLRVNDMSFTGTGDVTWNNLGRWDIYGNLINNSTCGLIGGTGNATGGSNNSGDRFFFQGTGVKTIGSLGGDSLYLNQISVASGCTLQLLQNITLRKANGGGTASDYDKRTLGVQTGGQLNLNGKTITLDITGTNIGRINLGSIENGSATLASNGGWIYFKTATNGTNILYFRGPESLSNLRVAGSNGAELQSAVSIGNGPYALTLTGQLYLESTFNLLRGSNNGLRFNVNHQAKIVRNTGSLTESTANTIVFPSAPNYYDLVYNGGSTVSSGIEWSNSAVVRHLTIGPESGVPNSSGVTVSSLGSRAIIGDLVLNTNASTALSTSTGLPINTAGSTVYRYGSGTVSIQPVYPTSINIYYGGNFTSGPELPTGAQANYLNNLTINPGSGNTLTLAGNANVAGNLLMQSGTTDLSTFTANRQTSGGTLSLAASAVLKIGGTNTFPTNYSTVSLSRPSSTVEYYGTAQTIGNQQYGNLTISGVRGGANVTLASGTIDVNNVFQPSATFSGGGYVVSASNTINFSGSNGQQIPEFNYANLSSSNNSRTLVGTIGVSEVFTPGSGTYTTTSSTVNYNGSGAQTIQPLNYFNLTVSGTRATNSVTLSNTGTIQVGGTLSLTATFSSGNYVNAGSTVEFNGASQVIPAIPTIGYNNLTIAQASGNAAQTESLLINGTLALNGGKLICNGFNITIGASGTIAVTSPSGSKMIDLASGGIVRKTYTTPSGVSFTWPIGTGSQYVPATISNMSATGSGTIGLEVFNTNSPSVSDVTVAMDRYWNVTVSGLTITSTNVSFTYQATDVVGNEANYVARRFSGGSWNNDGASITSRVISATGITSIGGEWTAGEPAAFVSVTVFYSLGGDWATASSWSNTGFGGAVATSTPTSSDVVQIGDNKTITVGSYAISSASLQLQSTGILEFTDLPNAGNALGSVTGTGTIRFNNSTSSTPNWPGGNLGTFLGVSGGTVEFAGNGNYTIPNLTSYNRLTFAGTGTKTIASTISTLGAFTIASGNTTMLAANLNAGNTVTINGTLSQTSGSINFNAAASQSLNGSPTACTFNNFVIGTGTSLSSSISFNVLADFTNSSNATTSFDASSGTVTFSGGTSQLINGSGTGALKFYGLTIGSGSQLSTAYSLEIKGDITNSSNGIGGVSFNHTAGTLNLVGGITQNFTGSGTGAFNVNELILSGATTLASTASMNVATNFTNNSSLISALDATAGTITFSSATATISGTGPGDLAFYNLQLTGACKLTTTRDLLLRKDLVNNSTGQSGVSMVASGVVFGFNGVTPQVIGGSGTGSLVFDDFTILPNARVNTSTTIELKGDFTNNSIGQSGVSFDQTAGTVLFSGSSIQSIGGTGSGSVTFNNLTISNTPSRVNVTSSFALLGNLTNNSNGISSYSLNATTGTITFNGTSAQSLSGTGSGLIAFNHIAVTGTARLNISVDYSVQGNYTVSSTGLGSPATAVNSTAGTLLINGASAQTLGGSGTGLVQLYNLQISSAPSRLLATRDFSISNIWNNSSNGISANAFTGTASTVTFNGSACQFTGTGTGSIIFNNLTLASGAYVNATLNLQVTGTLNNNSNGVGGFSWDAGASGSAITFNGNTTQSITGSGTGVLEFRGFTVSSGTRVDCDKDILNLISSISLNGSGLGSPARVFNQTAGTFTISLGGGGQNLSGTGSGSVVFNNLTLTSNASGSYSLNRGFDVAGTLTVSSSNSGNFTVTNASNLTFNVNNLTLGGTSSLINLSAATTGATNRTHTFNISGDVVISGAANFISQNNNGTNYNLIQVNMTKSGGSISGSGNGEFNMASLNVSGSYTNTCTSDSIFIGTESALVPNQFAGTGSWTQGANGEVTLRLSNAEHSIANFIATGSGNIVRIVNSVSGTKTIPTSSFVNLVLTHTGSPTAVFNTTADLLVSGSLNLTAGTLSMGNNNLTVNGSTTWTGTLSVGNNTVTFGGATSQSVPALSYYQLVKAGVGTATLAGNVTVRNGLDLQGGSLTLGGNSLTLGVSSGDVVEVKRGTGTISAAPTFTSGAIYNYTYNPTSNVTISMGNEMLPASNTTDLFNLTINHTGSSNNTVTADRNLTVNGNLTLTAGNLDISTRTITYKGSSIVRGTGTIITSSGGGGTQLIFASGGSSYTLPNGIFNASPAPIRSITQNGTGTVTFGNQDISLSEGVIFSAAGFLNTGTGTFRLGTTGALTGEANDRYLRGSVESIKSVNLPASAINFGNMGVTMRNYSQNIGSAVSVIRSAGVAGSVSTGDGGLAGNQSVRTKWSISGITTQPSNGVQLELTWFADNDNTTGCGACNVSSMAIFTRSTPSDPWERLRLGNVWTNANVGGNLRKLFVVATHFSEFTPGYEAAPLPISLGKLTGYRTQGGTQLNWVTFSEKEAKHFEVERSIGGNSFELVGVVGAAGNSSTVRQYNWLDAGNFGGAYYRLKMVDLDGSYEYSKSVYVPVEAVSRKVSLSPNPAKDRVALSFSGYQQDEIIMMTVVGADGKVIGEQTIAVNGAPARLNDLLSDLSKGVYLIRIASNEQTETVKLVKE